jgi:tape measure domain-containing protein
MADQTVTLRIKSDATGVVASVDLVKSKMGDLGNTSQQAGQRAAAGLSMARRGVESISAQLRNLQNLASVWAAFAGVRAVVRDLVSTADAMTSLNARLRIATGSTEAYAQAQQTVQAVAISARSDLESVATLYTRLAQSSQSLGISQQELGEITEAVSMAVTLSGGSAASAAAGVQQLAQAFASGVLSGDEFRSVMENSPRVVKALTDTLGVSVGELRKLAEQQKLTADIVADSLRLQLTAMQAEMTKMPQTVGQALGQVSNAWSLYVNNVNQAAGVTGSLAQVLDGITTLLMAEANASHESAGGLEFLAAGLQIVTIAGVAFKNVVEVIVNGVAMLADIVGTVTSTIGTLLANSIQSLQEYQSAILRLDFDGAWQAVADGNARNMATIKQAGQQIAVAYETAQAGVESAHNDIAKSWAALTEVQARAVKLTGEQMATLGAAFSGGEGGLLGGVKAFGAALYDMAKGPQDEIDELRQRVEAMLGSVETGADGATKKTKSLATAAKNLTDATGEVDTMLRSLAYGLADGATRALMDYEDVQARILDLELQWLDLGPMSEAQIAKLAELRKLAADTHAKNLADLNAETVREAQWAAEQSARAWEGFTYDLASAIADGSQGVKRWWKAMIDDMKRQLIQSGLLKLMQALFGNKSSGLSLAGSGGTGIGSIFSSLFGGGGASGAGGTSMFGQLFSAKSWASAGKSLWAGLFGAANLSGIGGTAGYGVLAGLGGSAQVGSGAFAAYTGVGSTGSYGVLAGGTGYGTGAGGATSAGGMGAGALGGWIAAAVVANLLSWQHGYRPDGGSVQTPWGSTVQGDGMGSGGWDFAGKIITQFATGLLSKLGLSDKWASVLGGSSLVTRVFGHRAPEITGSGAQYSFGPGGISGDQWADIYQKGGFLRSSKRWTERGALDAETIKNIEAFWQAIVDANAETARVLGLESAASVAASFKQSFDKDGKLTSEAGTILGRTYAESWEVFTQRIAAENIIANIDAALGTQVQAVGEATVGAMIAGANARIAGIRGPIDYTLPEYGGGGGPGVGAGPSTPQPMGEASAIAERWRHDAELLAQGAQFLLLAATDIQHGAGLLGEGGTLTQITNLVEELGVGSETLVETYARVATSTALLDQALDMSGVQIDGTREHIVRLATAITDAAGGLDRAEALWGAYFDRFYTEAERAQYMLTQAQASAASEFGDIGMDYTQFTGEGGTQAFRELFENALPTLSAEAVVEWLEAAAALGIVIDATDALNAAMGDVGTVVTQTADQLATVTGLLDNNAWELAAAGVTDAQRAVAQINRAYEEHRETLLANAATAEQLATLESQRTQALAQAEAQRVASLSSLLDGIAWDAAVAGMSQLDAELAQLTRQFDGYIAQAIALGATEEQLALIRSAASEAAAQAQAEAAEAAARAAAEEAQRLAQVQTELQQTLDSNAWALYLDGLSGAQRAVAELTRYYDDLTARLAANGATAEQLATAEEQRALAMQQLQAQLQAQIGDILGGLEWDAALAGMTEFERQMAEFGRQWDEYAAQLANLGASEEQLAMLEGLRADALARLLAAQAEQAAAEQAEAEAALAQGAADYREFIRGVVRETQSLTDYQAAMRDAGDWQAQAIATANEHARAAGMAGASEQALAVIERRAAQLRAQALAQLREETQSLIDQLYGSGGDSIGEALTSGIEDAGIAAADYWAQQRQAAETLQAYLDGMLLGDLSALTPAEQLEEAWSQLNAAVAAGDAQQATQLADVYLRMLREMEASGEDYNSGFWDVRELLQGMLDGIGPIGSEPTDGAGGSGYITAAGAEQIAAQNRLDLAVQLAQHLADLSSAVGQTVYDLMQSMGVDLHELTADLGINLQAITGETVLALVNMADLLGSNLLDLTGQLGVSLTDMGAGITELAEQMGISLQDLTAESAMALGNLANQLGIDLSQIGESVGADLGSLADAQSLLNQALAAQIGALPDGTGDALAPYLDAIATATTEADANAAINAMSGYINTLAPDIRNALAPYFADVFPVDALNDLDYLSAISAATDAAAVAAAETNALLLRVVDNLAAANTAAGVPSYAVGTGYVPQDGMAMIHRGEAIIPAPFAAWMRENGLPVSGGAGSSPEMLAELRAIRDRLDSIERSDRSNAEHISITVAKTGEVSDRNNDQSRKQAAQMTQRRGVTA